MNLVPLASKTELCNFSVPFMCLLRALWTFSTFTVHFNAMTASRHTLCYTPASHGSICDQQSPVKERHKVLHVI